MHSAGSPCSRGRWAILSLSLHMMLCFGACTLAAEPWLTVSPENAGFDPAKLEALWNTLQERKTSALLIIRHDQIVFERYAPGQTRHSPHYTASLAKALVGG